MRLGGGCTPLTFNRYTLHTQGTSFGTKFEGLDISRTIFKAISGLFHVGSVGIIMSGWLGAINYGVIVANDADAFLRSRSWTRRSCAGRTVIVTGATRESGRAILPWPFLSQGRPGGRALCRKHPGSPGYGGDGRTSP